jgi:two-component system sensor histidine kinase ResE
MDMLINNLLRLTKLDSEVAQAAFEPLSTATLIEAAVSQVKKVAELKQITILTEGKSRQVQGDHDALIQLLVILLDNAIKYSPVTSTVTITTSQTDDTVQLRVKDEGQGIAPAALPHVFDRFYRADASRNKTTTDGFGLGLSIAKMIADRHQGDITLTSRLKHGTTAIISLPMPAASPAKQ